MNAYMKAYPWQISEVEPKDRNDILALCDKLYQQIHGMAQGREEYIQNYIDEWIRTRGDKNIFLKATINGRIVGIGNFSFLTENEAIIEGGRVDKEFWNRGIATSLLEVTLEKAKQKLCHPIIVRFLTDSYNEPSLALARRIGMVQVAEFRALEKDFSSAVLIYSADIEALSLDEKDVAWHFVDASEVFNKGGRLFLTGWRVRNFTRSDFDKFSSQNGVFVTHDGKGNITGLVLVNRHQRSTIRHKPTVEIPLIIAKNAESWRKLLGALGSFVTQEMPNMIVFFVNNPLAENLLRREGFSQKIDHTDVVLAMQLV